MSDDPDTSMNGPELSLSEDLPRPPIGAPAHPAQTVLRQKSEAERRRLDRKLPPAGVVFCAVKGTICLVPVLQGPHRLYGQFSRFRMHELGIVTSVAKSGAVGSYRCYGARVPGLWHEVEGMMTDPEVGFLGCYIVPPDRFPIDSDDVLYHVPYRFQSVDDARAALKPYLGNALCPQSII